MDWTDPTLTNLLAGFFFLGALASSVHAMLYRRDPRAALLWVGLIWLSPFLGSLLYLMFGINRIHRKAASLRGDKIPGGVLSPAESAPAGNATLMGLVRLGDQLCPFPFSQGNRVEPLIDGDAAFPAMLEAIRNAKNTVTLMTYIFDRDAAGREFVTELEAAVGRGVQVRVLIDDVGRRYSFPSILRTLKKSKIPHASFLPTLVPWQAPFLNLRNHRKLLVVDREVAFTGGMNIRIAHWLGKKPKAATRDVQFEIHGPAVHDLATVFDQDWSYATGEPRSLPAPTKPLGQGQSHLRVIPDGPDGTHRRIRSLLLGSVSAAARSIKIQTPYFLPDAPLISALSTSALRGVQVDILLPQKSNLPWVHWAMQASLWQVLESGCRVWLLPPPFDHSKLVVVDEVWTLFGSSNWDHRSLRLNFELNVESTDPKIARQITSLLDQKRNAAIATSLVEVDSRGGMIRLRDSMARLLTPML